MFDLISSLANPMVFSVLSAWAVFFIWLAFAPGRPARQVEDRLDGYLKRETTIESNDMDRPFMQRVLWPPLRSLLRSLGRLLPSRNLASLQPMLLQAGTPGRLSALDFTGLRLLLALALGAPVFLLVSQTLDTAKGVGAALLVALLGYLIPIYWLRSRIKSRRHEIQRALPDALDMMTIGGEAGMACESARRRVGDQWDNELTREFIRAVAEMRLGSTRSEALQRLADRCDVQELTTFVAIVIQSTQLGVSIADVLHNQAATMRVKRRQRAEEQAQQASVKMVFPLILFIFPALLVMLLGPAIPVMIDVFSSM